MAKRIMTIIMAVFMLLPVNVFARDIETNDPSEKTTLNIDVKMDGSSTSAPLSLKADKGTFYFAKNISPGDELRSEIVFKNTEKVTVQVAVLNVDDRSNLKGDLGDEIGLEVFLGKDKIYKGPYSKITDPLTNWIPVKPGEELAMDIYMNIPKELDNRFQGAKIDAEWNFGVRSNILNGVKVKIIYKDEEGKIIKTEEKEFDYDKLVTDKDITPPDGYKIIGFTPKKVTKDGDEIEVIVKKSGIKVEFIFKDKNGKIIKVEEKEVPGGKEIEEKDIPVPGGYKIVDFEKKIVTKDGDKVNVTVEKDNDEKDKNNYHNVTFIYKDKNGNVIKTIVKQIPHGHQIVAGDLDNLDGYNNLTFDQKVINNDDTINVTVEKVPSLGKSPERVKTGDKTRNYAVIALCGAGLIGLYLFEKKKKDKK